MQKPGPRCTVCFWSLYDGDYCQNPDCERYGKSEEHPILLTTDEAMSLIEAKATTP